MKRKILDKSLVYWAIVVILFLIPIFITGEYQLHVMILVGIAVIMSSSLRVIFNSGQLSMGHGGLMTLGAYTAALLVMKLGWSSWAALVASAASAGLLALLVGFPFVRLKGIYFSLITVFLGIIIGLIFEQWRSVTGGAFGISGIPKPDSIMIAGLINIQFNSKIAMYYLILIVLLISLIILYLIEHSRIGLTFASIRESDFLIESVGVNTAWYKILSFTIGCLFAGLAGGLYSQYLGIITPNGFGFIYSVYIMIYVIVGGNRRFAGPIIGAVILTILPEVARPLKAYQPFIFAGILMLVIFLLPDGLVSLPQKIKNWVSRRQNKSTKLPGKTDNGKILNV
jgi:branched-chain amino acid transport system permease protein